MNLNYVTSRCLKVSSYGWWWSSAAAHISGKDDRLVTFKPMLRLVKKSGLGKTFEFSSYT
jgi:hypothetical protein